MKQARLNRLFGASGRCLDVAVDHGMFDEPAFLPGIEDLGAAVRTLAAAAPDAIQLSAGMAPALQAIPGRQRPALVLRTDVANVYGTALPDVLWSRLAGDPVADALRLDAACVVVNLLQLPGQPDLHGQCVENIAAVRAECERWGMPLMIEPLVMQANAKAGGYMVDGTFEKVRALVRQAAELGADVIKADPTDDLARYGDVVKAAGRPVLVRGGGRVPDEEILRRTAVVLAQGAAGIVYGRNIIQHPHPDRMTRALMALLHAKATPEDGLTLLRG